MQKFDFKNVLVGNDGQPAQNGQTLSKTLSEFLGRQTKGKSLKLYGWHKDLQVGNDLNLDESDTTDLKKLIEEDENLFVFVKGQLLEVLNNPQKT